MALTKYTVFVQDTETGAALDDVTVRVLVPGAAPQSAAPTFSDRSGTPKTSLVTGIPDVDNPLRTGNARGRVTFYIEEGNYDIESSRSGSPAFIDRDVPIFGSANGGITLGAFGTILVANATAADARGDLEVLSAVQVMSRGPIYLANDLGADPTGVLDATAIINTAITNAVSQKRPIFVDGHFRQTAQITVPENVVFLGHGALTSYETVFSPSRFIKDYDGLGFLFQGDNSGSSGVQFDAAAGRAGDNVQITGSRCSFPSICVTRAGRDNIRIGADNQVINANLWFIGELHSYAAVRHGVYIHHTTADTPVNYPLGVPNVNAGALMHGDIARNGGDGIVIHNAIDNYFGNLAIQSNVGTGFRLKANARNNICSKCYTEENGSDGIIEAGANQNIIWASRAVTLTPGWTIDAAAYGNMLFGHYAGIGAQTDFSQTPWAWPSELAIRSAGAVSRLMMFATANDVPIEFRCEADGASGTKMIFATRRMGVGLVDVMTLREDGTVEIAGTLGLKVNGNKVIGERQAAIADQAVAVAAPTKAEFDALAAKFNTLLAAVRTHGLIAT